MKDESTNNFMKIQKLKEGLARDREGNCYSKLTISKYSWIYYVLIGIFTALILISIVSPETLYDESGSLVYLFGGLDLIMILCLFFIRRSKIIITEESLIIKRIFTTKISIADLRQADLEIRKGTTLIINSERKKIKISTSSYINGLDFCELLLNIIGKGSRSNEFSVFHDIFERYNVEIIKFVFVDLFFLIGIIGGYLIGFSGTAEFVGEKCYSVEKYGPVLSFLYVTLIKNSFILFICIFVVIIYIISIIHKCKKQIRNNEAVGIGSIRLLGLAAVLLLSFTIIKDEKLIDNVANYYKDINNYKMGNIIENTVSISKFKESNLSDYPGPLTEYKKNASYTINIYIDEQSRWVYCPISVYDEKLKETGGRCDIKYLPLTKTVVSIKYNDVILNN